jgi:urease accessory protein UreH
MAARVGSGSYLRAAAPPLIPFAGAAVAQTTVVCVAAGGECLLVESGCPGRTQMGERWAFDRLAYRLTVLHDDRVVYRERWDLRPPAVPFAASGFGDYLGWGTCVACGPRAVAELSGIRRRLADGGAAVTGGAITDDIVVARVLDPHGYLITGLAASLARAAQTA